MIMQQKFNGGSGFIYNINAIRFHWTDSQKNCVCLLAQLLDREVYIVDKRAIGTTLTRTVVKLNLGFFKRQLYFFCEAVSAFHYDVFIQSFYSFSIRFS